MNFEELGLKNPILNATKRCGYSIPTPIQEQTIPLILKRNDILGCAQTGTGKTAAFALPVIQLLLEEYISGKKTNVNMLILSPTRELAMQIRNNIRDYTENTKLKCSVIFGGVNQASQKEVLKKGIDILVATPGRLLDLVNQKKADLSEVKYLVLDEADTMLDMGFINDIKKIMSFIPKHKQTLLFSATMSNDVRKLAETFLNNPINININSNIVADKIDQEVYFVDKVNKQALLLDILNEYRLAKSILIFTRTKHGADKLSKFLSSYNVKCEVIHGDKTQSARVKALANFKSLKSQILLATDIAARGIDINELSLVINYEIPEFSEVYVHRIGRTARAGLNGKAISLCSIDEKDYLKDIEKLIKLEIPVKENEKYPMKVLVKTKKNVRGKNSSKKISVNKISDKKTFSKKSTNKNNDKSPYNSNNKKYKPSSNRKFDYKKKYKHNKEN